MLLFMAIRYMYRLANVRERRLLIWRRKMNLNFYQAWHYHYIAKIKQPFKLWLKTKPQGKVKVYGEWEDNGMYDIPEADDNEEFQKWILNERKKNEEGR